MTYTLISIFGSQTCLSDYLAKIGLENNDKTFFITFFMSISFKLDARRVIREYVL